jgi:tetratricopeptide (TPR) repeat protein
MPDLEKKVIVREDTIILPSYAIKGENRNPVFHSQYGVAHIYPYTMLDDIDNKKRDKTYHTLVMENQYLKVTVIPDLGGRVYSVYDKISKREVFYKNSVVRFAPLAIRGAFFSGGVEFSFPVAHAPTTCDKVNWNIRENQDGSASISIGGLEHISRLRWMITLTLFPDRCAMAQDVYLHNPGTIPGRYHYWTNASLDANDGTEFIYPLHRARSYEYAGTASWPFARLDLITEEPGLPGMEGVPMWPAKRLQAPVNFRWQKNMLAQVSIFGRKVEWDYFGAWQHTVNHGYAHVAKSSDVSGMKLWSWGNAPVGVVNQTSLTDDGAVYAETQCGALETQLDFAFLEPGKTRSWREWWLPLRGLGGLTCASEFLGAKVSISPKELDKTVTINIAICPSMEIADAEISLSIPGDVLIKKITDLSPQTPWSDNVVVKASAFADKPLSLSVKDKNGRVLLDIVQKRDPDKISDDDQSDFPESGTPEGYYLQGLIHENFDNREQAKETYQKSISISDTHADTHIRYGLMLLRSAQFKETDAHFKRAVELGNPEGHYYRGQAALLLRNFDEAEEHFLKAINNKSLEMAACIGIGKVAINRKEYTKAVDFFSQAGKFEEESVAPQVLSAIAMRLAGNQKEAYTILTKVIARDPLHHLALHEIALGNYLDSKDAELQLDRMLEDDPAYFYDLACFYLDAGLPEIALEVLNTAWVHYPKVMVAYLAAFICHQIKMDTESSTWLKNAKSSSPEYGFPSRLEEILALEYAIQDDKNDFLAKYLLGNFYYAHERYDEGINLWLESIKSMPTNDVLLRNLGLAFWKRRNDEKVAIDFFEKAHNLNPQNQDLFIHLDDLYKSQDLKDKRKKLLGEIKVNKDVREDVHKRSISMLVDLGDFQEAIRLMETEKFIPLEMDQSFHNTYVQSLMLRANDHLKNGKIEDAINDFQRMLKYPENLGVGAPTTRRQAHIYYQLGLAYEKTGQYRLAINAWKEAASEHHAHGNDLYPYIQMALDKLSRYSELGME